MDNLQLGSRQWDSRSSERQRGITLLEILVAFGILALFLIPFLQAFLTTKQGAQMTGDYNRALYLAQKVMEDIRYCAYNERTENFQEFMSTVTLDEDGDMNRVVPLDDTGDTVEGRTSGFFSQVFDPEPDPIDTDDMDNVENMDSVIVKRLDKFTITTTWEQTMLDDGKADPNSATVRVLVRWKEPKLRTKNETIEREVNLYTVIGQTHRILNSLSGDTDTL
ncbi:MAG: type II secretion system protein [bacterium]|jgi:type II secretory pathway pseudopilin PulG|nr:type II secretion system protein [bacterium]